MSRPFKNNSYIEFDGKRYMYLNDDRPTKAYETPEVSFVAQPLSCAYVNQKHNVIPVPLMMTDLWDILQKNPSLVGELRKVPKVIDYIFVGQWHYMDRNVFWNLQLDNYYFEQNPISIFHLDDDVKHAEIIKFLTRIASSKFVFAPRGMGSSSFRLYEAFMVGSIPIVTGMNDYPFEGEMPWDMMSVRGQLAELPQLIEKSKELTPAQWEWCSKLGQDFWDEYCKHDKLYEKLKRHI